VKTSIAAIILTLLLAQASFSSLIVKELPGSGLVAVSIFIKAYGPAAALTAGMLDKGTKTRSADKIAEEIESMGASIGIESNPDYTGVSFLSLSKDFPKGAEILKDLLSNSIFPQKEFTKEKADALAEIKQAEDNPDAMAYDTLLSMLYPNHPYGLSFKEKAAYVKRVTRQDLVSFYRQSYREKNMVVAIAGDITSAEAARFFGDSDRGGDGKNSLPSVKSNPKEINRTIKNKNLKADWLQIGYLGTSVFDADYPALKVLSSILGSGMSSRLFEEVRKKSGLVYSIGAFYPSRKEKSDFTVYAITGHDNLQKVKTLIFNEIEKIKKTPVTEAELNHHKRAIRGKYVIQHQELSRKAWFLGWFEAVGLGAAMDQNYPNLINAVKIEDIQRVAQKYLKYPKTVVLTAN